MENAHKTSLTLQQQANAFQYYYEDNGPKPCAHFWKQLTIGRQCPHLLIPDTLILNLKEQPLLWVYTNNNGRVESNTNVSLKDFVNKVTSFCSPNELVATMKRLICKNEANNFGNDIKLVNSRYLHNLSLQQLGDHIFTVQKYIKSHGKQAFICRTVLSTQKHSYCFLITNKAHFYDQEVPENKRFLVNNTHANGFPQKTHIILTATGKHLQETLPFLQQIVTYMRFQRGTNLTQLVGDFIKDEEGHWWLVNIKAFKVEPSLSPSVKGTTNQHIMRFGGAVDDKQKYQRTKECRYCEKSYLQSQLTHKLTRKMLIQMDRYLLHLGKNYDWLARSDASTDSHTLYQESKVCARCYRLYIEIQALLSFEGKFLRKLNLNTEGQPKDLLMRLTSKEQLQMQSKDKEIMNLKNKIPEQISLGPNSSIITRNDCPLRNDQTIHQMARYRFLIYLHELDQLTPIPPHTNYYLDFSIFNSRFKLKLDLRPGMKSTLIKKVRLCYFFIPLVDETLHLQQYIHKHKALKITLIAQNHQTSEKRNAGNLTLDLKEFLVHGRKSFYKFLDTQGGFGWGLEGSIGLVRTEKEVNTSRLILSTTDRLIYLPSPHYYICQPLPEDWISEIQNKNKGKSNELMMKTNNCLNAFSAQTGQQFLPDQTFKKKSVKLKELDWTGQLKKELQIYQKSSTK